MDLEAEISFHESSSMHADFPDTPQPEPVREPQAAAGLVGGESLDDLLMGGDDDELEPEPEPEPAAPEPSGRSWADAEADEDDGELPSLSPFLKQGRSASAAPAKEAAAPPPSSSQSAGRAPVAASTAPRLAAAAMASTPAATPALTLVQFDVVEEAEAPTWGHLQFLKYLWKKGAKQSRHLHDR